MVHEGARHGRDVEGVQGEGGCTQEEYAKDADRPAEKGGAPPGVRRVNEPRAPGGRGAQ